MIVTVLHLQAISLSTYTYVGNYVLLRIHFKTLFSVIVHNYSHTLFKDVMQMKYMIVDDNAGMREMIRETACSEHDAVLECSDGIEAVSAFATFHPDIVLMDIEMKKMDGFTASEKIYQQDPNARIIFITSHNTSAFRMKAKLMKAAGFVTKENLSELTNLLH